MSDVLKVKLMNSLVLMITAWILSGILGFALGAVSGMNQGRWADKAVKGYCLLIAGTPTFWLALVLLLVFGVWLKVLPIGLSVPIGVELSLIHILCGGQGQRSAGMYTRACPYRGKRQYH